MNWTFKAFASPGNSLQDGLAASRHLTHQQICDLLLAAQRVDCDANLTQAAHQQHLDACLICASELSLLRTSVTGFRDVSIAMADQALARQTRSRLLPVKRNVPYLSPTFFWAATGILFAAVLPLSLFHQNLNPMFKAHTSPPTVATSAPATATTVESDEALLEGINQDLSTSIPSAMQPLAGSIADNSAAASQSPYLKNEKE